MNGFEKIGLGGGIVIVVVGIALTKAGTWQYGLPAIVLGVAGIVYGVINLFGGKA